ncbi:hypothetical protein F5Y15DRAFT_190975 [Xylariaceae sp. FL0016]|nr:hypothetical protein F5Y15DRAFT_190975 [Xylariaceae sp. FL0016]
MLTGMVNHALLTENIQSYSRTSRLPIIVTFLSIRPFFIVYIYFPRCHLTIMGSPEVEIVNLSGTGLPRQEARKAAVWMAKAFARAPATPALTMFFGAAPYEDNVEMHERFWAAHLNRVAMSGILLAARDIGGGVDWGTYHGFRAFFEPGKARSPYSADFRLDDNEDWDRYLELAGQKKYEERLVEWGEKTAKTNEGLDDLNIPGCYTTSIIVVDPEYQRRGIGRALDEHTRKTVRDAGRQLHVRIHEYILPFYLAQGYRVMTSATYTLQGSKPFVVHFLLHEVK